MINHSTIAFPLFLLCPDRKEGGFVTGGAAYHRLRFGPPSHQPEEEGAIDTVVKPSLAFIHTPKHAINAIGRLFSTPAREGHEAPFPGWISM